MKIEFMHELVDVRTLLARPWLFGDFNLLVNPTNKSNFAVNRRKMAKFWSKLNTLELKEMHLNGRRFTWSNERDKPTVEKIDHVFCTNSWEEAHPSSFLTALGMAISDHCPILVV